MNGQEARVRCRGGGQDRQGVRERDRNRGIEIGAFGELRQLIVAQALAGLLRCFLLRHFRLGLASTTRLARIRLGLAGFAALGLDAGYGATPAGRKQKHPHSHCQRCDS